MIVSPS